MVEQVQQDHRKTKSAKKNMLQLNLHFDSYRAMFCLVSTMPRLLFIYFSLLPGLPLRICQGFITQQEHFIWRMSKWQTYSKSAASEQNKYLRRTCDSWQVEYTVCLKEDLLWPTAAQSANRTSQTCVSEGCAFVWQFFGADWIRKTQCTSSEYHHEDCYKTQHWRNFWFHSQCIMSQSLS